MEKRFDSTGLKLRYLCLPALLAACTKEQNEQLGRALLLVTVAVLVMGTVFASAVTVGLVLKARKTRAWQYAVGLAGWGILLLGLLFSAFSSFGDMTLDSNQSDFWWSAWATAVLGLAGGVSLVVAAETAFRSIGGDREGGEV